MQGEGRAPICGNTPTHVGKTLFRPQDVPREEKHPHARGEDVSDGTTRGQYRETPPRTWGRHTHQMALRMKERNTPTHVGKTSAGRPAAYRRWKHPHARGEDIKEKNKKKFEKETPPRTWGRLVVHFQRRGLLGNTPTHVGKTAAALSSLSVLWKHPHARGED